MLVVDGEQQYRLQGRVATIVRWLAAQAERLTVPERIAVTFDCAGSKVSAEVREREPVDAALAR